MWPDVRGTVLPTFPRERSHARLWMVVTLFLPWVRWMMTTWPDTWLSPSTNANISRLSSLRWTASSIPTLQPSDPAGPANPSTYMPASKPSSPSNSPSRAKALINKPRSEPALLLGKLTTRTPYGQQIQRV